MSDEEQGNPRAEFAHLLDSHAAAPSSALASIVARVRRRRERRLKAVASVSIVVAIAGASLAGVTWATNSTTSAFQSRTIPATGLTPTANGAWTKRNQRLGTAPKGLSWSSHPASSSSSGPGVTTPNATGPVARTNLCTVNGCGYPFPSGSNGPMTGLFDRKSGDITMRAFTETMIGIVPLPAMSNGSTPTPSSSVPSPNTGAVQGPPVQRSPRSAPTAAMPVYSSCESAQTLVVEVSNPSAIGTITVPLPSISISEPGQPFEVIDSSVVGVPEGSPIEVLTVHVTSEVSSVQASFADGTSDQMTVIDGWAVFADDGSAPLPATITTFDNSGQVIATATVNDDNAVAQPLACATPYAGPPQVGNGTASPATGSK